MHLHVHDVEGVARFYGHLGFVEVARHPDDLRAPEDGPVAESVELVLEGLSLLVLHADLARRSHGLAVGPSSARIELAVQTDDVDARCAALVDAGAEVVAAPRDLTRAVRGAWLRDPAGNVVQLVSTRWHDVPDGG